MEKTDESDLTLGDASDRGTFTATGAGKNDPSNKAVAAQTAISPICHYATRVAVYTRNIISVLVCYGLSSGIRGEGIRTTGKVQGDGWWHTKRCARRERVRGADRRDDEGK